MRNNRTTISLKEFALTGKFGPVHTGMHRDAAVKLLGKPDADHHFKTGYSRLLYAWYELFYETETGRITGIQNDHLEYTGKHHKHNIVFRNSKIEVDIWFLKPGRNISFEELQYYLQEEQITYAIEKYVGNDMIRFQSGTYMDFALLEEDGENILNGIRHFSF